jgi:hypothetical protein
MSFAKEPLTIVLCLDHAFGRAGEGPLRQCGRTEAARSPADRLRRGRTCSRGAKSRRCRGRLPWPERPAWQSVSGRKRRCRGPGTNLPLMNSPGCWAAYRGTAQSYMCTAGQKRCRHRSPCQSRDGSACGLYDRRIFPLLPNGGFYNYQRGHTFPLERLSRACWATHCDSQIFGLHRDLAISARCGRAAIAAGTPNTSHLQSDRCSRPRTETL